MDWIFACIFLHRTKSEFIAVLTQTKPIFRKYVKNLNDLYFLRFLLLNCLDIHLAVLLIQI